MIYLKDFSFRYAGSAAFAVRDVDLIIPDGRFVGIVGAAGAGKSTVLRAMNGLIPHWHPGEFYGSVVVGSLDTVDASLTDISRLVGSVMQDASSQMVTEVVEREICYGLENFGVAKEQMTARCEEALAMAGIADLRANPVASLSPAQKRRVCLAALVALRPKIALVDMPVSSDADMVADTFELLKRCVREQGTTAVVATRDMLSLEGAAERLIVLEEGSIVADGPVDKILRDTHAMAYLSQEEGR